jgi:hypothetical protein
VTGSQRDRCAWRAVNWCRGLTRNRERFGSSAATRLPADPTGSVLPARASNRVATGERSAARPLSSCRKLELATGSRSAQRFRACRCLPTGGGRSELAVSAAAPSSRAFGSVPASSTPPAAAARSGSKPPSSSNPGDLKRLASIAPEANSLTAQQRPAADETSLRSASQLRPATLARRR